MTDTLQQYINRRRAHFEQQLERRFCHYATTQSVPPTLLSALRYSSLDGGKRVRAMLVYMATEACGESENTVGDNGDHLLDNALENALDSAAMAVELLHCYSLVHDDLPAMDDDAMRRGKPSCHIQFDEATAILAGDALQALAFEWIAEADASEGLRLALLRCLATAAGAAGMVGGQALDLAAVGKQLSYDELVAMHRLKTGALIEAAVQMGSLCGGADSTQRAALHDYAGYIGLAFQVQDDILDLSLIHI